MEKTTETRVDVLEVLDNLICGSKIGGAKMREVRAVVAELINAARDAAAILQSKAGPLEQETPSRLYAALARIGGAA